MSKQFILNILRNQDVQTAKTLAQNMNISLRLVSSYIKELREDQAANGFVIETIRSSGYRLKIIDEKIFEAYVDMMQKETIGIRYLRLPRLFFYLLQENKYVTIQKLCEVFDVSRNTLVKDLDDLRNFVTPFELSLESKSHYGVKIVGEEIAKRRAISKSIISENEHSKSMRSYLDFINQIDEAQLQKNLRDLLNRNKYAITKNSFDSIIEHLKVLLYRVADNNFISDMSVHSIDEKDRAYLIASEYINQVAQDHHIEIPQMEIYYLASQFEGKSTVDRITDKEQSEVMDKIRVILNKIDEDFMTDFSEDEELCNTLLLHMIPLLKRITYKLELDNPLIEFVSSRYANVFLVALQFIDSWPLESEITLSRDEVGYLALHFASHIERVKKKTLESYKRILIISEMGRSSAFLIREKVSSLFPNATIVFDIILDPEEINSNYPDLIITTTDIEESKVHAPVIQIHEMTTEQDIVDIKEYLVLLTNTKGRYKKRDMMVELFHPSLFNLTTSSDYLCEVEKSANQMVDEGFAAFDFPEMVIEREKHFSTIYEKGVAGPHSMILNAHTDSIGVIIAKKEMRHEGREVRLIFVINMCKGNLFLYREISRLMQTIINDDEILDKLCACDNFEVFIKRIQKIRY